MQFLATLLGFGLLSASDFLFHGTPHHGTEYSHCDSICTKTETSTVCGNDWNTYENECEMRKEACRTSTPLISVYEGRCRSSLSGNTDDTVGHRLGCMNIKCNYKHEPVCGSDLQRYNNPCHIIKRACFSKTPIIKIMDVPKTHLGGCSELGCPTCRDARPSDVPWCGSDRVTYPTTCHMQASACRKRTAVVALYAGECIKTEDE